MNERDHPHLVELQLPPGGFRSMTEDILASIASAAFKADAGADGTMKGSFS
jgi:hypothetical protein